MKQALISPIESVHSGYRIADVTESSFEVAEPLFWVECDDGVVADQYWYDPIDQTIKPVPAPPPLAAAPDQPAVTGVETL